MCSKRVWCHLLCLSEPAHRNPFSRNGFQTRPIVETSQRLVSAFRCRYCGLLIQKATEMMAHIRSTHGAMQSASAIAYVQQRLEPVRVRRRESIFNSQSSLGSADYPLSFDDLVFRAHSSSNTCSSMSAASGHLYFCILLLEHVEFQNSGRSHPHALTPRDWCRFVWVFGGARIWRLSLSWWLAF